MKVKRIICVIAASFLMVNCMAISAGAVSKEEHQNMSLVIERASGRFSLDVPAGKTVGATTSFPLEAGEKVRIRANYSPETASVDFGLIDPDGLFHPLRASGGSFDQSDEGLSVAYMDLDSASETEKVKIIAAREEIICNESWVADNVNGRIIGRDGKVKEELPHFSEIFPSDWEQPNFGAVNDEVESDLLVDHRCVCNG